MNKASGRGSTAVTQRHWAPAGRGVQPLSPAVPAPCSDLVGLDLPETTTLRDIAAEAKHFTDELDDQQTRFATPHYRQEARALAALLEQAAAAAHDLAVAANRTAETITYQAE